jgi:predicted nucleic acid-binding protein
MKGGFSILLDTNVVLDVLLDRSPHAPASSALWSYVESGEVRGLLPAHAITTIHYLLRQQVREPRARAVVASLLSVFAIAAVNDKVLADALLSESPDFEDAVAAAAAFHSGCDFIVTRDPRGFRASTIKVVTPEAANALIAGTRN